MRKVFENRTAGTLDTERVVRLYTGGVREVVKGDWDGEWWNRYVIIPRRLMLNEIKRIRKLTNGARFIDGWEWWDLLPEGASKLIRSASYSGPGSSFTNEPFKIKSSRKFIVIYQSGGLDI